MGEGGGVKCRRFVDCFDFFSGFRIKFWWGFWGNFIESF